jgi:hypothetical protein
MLSFMRMALRGRLVTQSTTSPKVAKREEFVARFDLLPCHCLPVVLPDHLCRRLGRDRCGFQLAVAQECLDRLQRHALL